MSAETGVVLRTSQEESAGSALIIEDYYELIERLPVCLEVRIRLMGGCA